MENNKNLLEEFTKEILDTAEKYFELKNSENYFIPEYQAYLSLEKY